MSRYHFGSQNELSKATVLEKLELKRPTEANLSVVDDRPLIGTLEGIIQRVEGRLAFGDFAA